MANNELNARVFRRNTKNIILIWEKKNFTLEQLAKVSVFVDEGGTQRKITFGKFTPHNPEKFKTDIVGLVINQKDNKLIVDKPYKLLVKLDELQKSAEISVLPLKQEVNEMYFMGYSHQENKWKPVTVVPTELGNALLVKLEKK